MRRNSLQITNISKARVAQKRSRCSLSNFGMPTIGENTDLPGRQYFSSENLLDKDISGLPETTDHQQFKI